SLAGSLIFRIAQDQPLRWPWSNLEQVFVMMATSHCFLGLLMLMILASEHRRALRGTEEFWHGILFCLWLLGTTICYFAAAKFNVGMISSWVAVAIYGSRLGVAIGCTPAPAQERMRQSDGIEVG